MKKIHRLRREWLIFDLNPFRFVIRRNRRTRIKFPLWRIHHQAFILLIQIRRWCFYIIKWRRLKEKEMQAVE